jgi:hypothetical protein
MLGTVLVYTGMVGAAHGWNFAPVFFGDIAAVSWAGQFNVDFSCLLLLSGLWMAWRHQFSALGLVLGVLALVGGTPLLASYLLIVSVQCRGDVKAMLLGQARAAS